MKFLFVLPLIVSAFFLNSAAAFSNGNANPVIGYQYNLWGLKADRLSGAEKLVYSGHIFLDVRKEYKVTYDRDEHWFYSKEQIEDGQVLLIQGSNKASLEVKHHKTEDYYVALKLGNKWSRFYYQDILNEANNKVGQEVGCKDCNFSEQIYLPEEDWVITLYFAIKPHYKHPIPSSEDDIEDLLASQNYTSTTTKSKAPSMVSNLQETVIEDEETMKTHMFLSTEKMPQIAGDELHAIDNNTLNKINKKFVNAPTPTVDPDNEISYHVLFRIMPTAFDEFEEVAHLGKIYRDTYKLSGKTRYLIGSSPTAVKAHKIAKELQKLGYLNLFITEYKHGKLNKFVNRLQ